MPAERLSPEQQELKRYVDATTAALGLPRPLVHAITRFALAVRDGYAGVREGQEVLLPQPLVRARAELEQTELNPEDLDAAYAVGKYAFNAHRTWKPIGINKKAPPQAIEAVTEYAKMVLDEGIDVDAYHEDAIPQTGDQSPVGMIRVSIEDGVITPKVGGRHYGTPRYLELMAKQLPVKFQVMEDYGENRQMSKEQWAAYKHAVEQLATNKPVTEAEVAVTGVSLEKIRKDVRNLMASVLSVMGTSPTKLGDPEKAAELYHADGLVTPIVENGKPILDKNGKPIVPQTPARITLIKWVD